jgi:hypothetical protein
MFVKQKEISFLKKKAASPNPSPEDTLQSLRSWIRKIEQSTTSVSSRLTAVEKRLSGGGITESDAANLVSMQGPLETFVRNGKKRNAGDLAHVLDNELTLLHNELVKQEQDLESLKHHLSSVEEKHTGFTRDIQSIQLLLSQMDEKVRVRMERLERREPFVMRLGAMEIPIEFTGIIGGLLAFTIAILVVLNQKTVLLSPVFLSAVGLLLIGSAMIKMIRTRSKTTLRPTYAMPLTTRSTTINPLQYERKEG